MRDLLKMVLELDGYENAKIKFDTTKPTMIPLRLVDTTKAERLLGFRANTDIREGLRRTLEWYRQSQKPPHEP